MNSRFYCSEKTRYFSTVEDSSTLSLGYTDLYSAPQEASKKNLLELQS